MAAYRRFYDSPHLQAGYQEPQEPESAPRDPTLGIRVWATFTFFTNRQTPGCSPRRGALYQAPLRIPTCPPVRQSVKNEKFCLVLSCL